jgi:hypothetical protein
MKYDDYDFMLFYHNKSSNIEINNNSNNNIHRFRHTKIVIFIKYYKMETKWFMNLLYL